MAERVEHGAIFIQVVPSGGAVSPLSRREDFVQATQAKLKEVSELIKTSLAPIVADIAAMPRPPSEVSLEFGVDVGTEAGIPFITKGSLGANFRVAVKWTREPARAADAG